MADSVTVFDFVAGASFAPRNISNCLSSSCDMACNCSRQTDSITLAGAPVCKTSAPAMVDFEALSRNSAGIGPADSLEETSTGKTSAGKRLSRNAASASGVDSLSSNWRNATLNPNSRCRTWVTCVRKSESKPISRNVTPRSHFPDSFPKGLRKYPQVPREDGLDVKVPSLDKFQRSLRDSWSSRIRQVGVRQAGLPATFSL